MVKVIKNIYIIECTLLNILQNKSSFKILNIYALVRNEDALELIFQIV